MTKKRLRTLEGLGLQVVRPCWAPLGTIVEGRGRAPSGLPFGASPHLILTPRFGEKSQMQWGQETGVLGGCCPVGTKPRLPARPGSEQLLA